MIRYNTIYNKIAASIITYGGEAVTADIYGNNIVQTDSGNYGRAIDIHTGYDYTGARFNVYHNTIYLANDSRGFYDGTNLPGVCTFKNNLIYNTGTNY